MTSFFFEFFVASWFLDDVFFNGRDTNDIKKIVLFLRIVRFFSCQCHNTASLRKNGLEALRCYQILLDKIKIHWESCKPSSFNFQTIWLQFYLLFLITSNKDMHDFLQKYIFIRGNMATLTCLHSVLPWHGNKRGKLKLNFTSQLFKSKNYFHDQVLHTKLQMSTVENHRDSF